jgi:hypothetical protein
MGVYRYVERGSKKVVKQVEANGPLDAERHCPRPRGDYRIELVAAGTPARESGGVRTVSLRESHSLPSIFNAVIDAVVSIDGTATDVDVRDDGLVTYHSGERIFRRTYQIADGDSPDSVNVVLGDAEEGELAFEPVESEHSRMKRYQSLLRLSRSLNPGESDRFHEAFIQGRDPTIDLPGQTRKEHLRQLSERLNPGRSPQFHEAYARGRD